MTADAPQPNEREQELPDAQQSPKDGVILERFKRMQTLPPHVRNVQDEFFIQSYLRKKRFAV